jgi:hypothetical protein
MSVYDGYGCTVDTGSNSRAHLRYCAATHFGRVLADVQAQTQTSAKITQLDFRLTQRPPFGILSVYISVLKGFRFEV